MEKMQQPRRFQQIPRPLLEPAQLEGLPESPRGPKRLNQHSEPGCVNVRDFAKIHGQASATWGFQAL
jgi:hypothetical protein